MRVVRSSKGRRISKYAPEEGNRYDGIYKVQIHVDGDLRRKMRKECFKDSPPLSPQALTPPHTEAPKYTEMTEFNACDAFVCVNVGGKVLARDRKVRLPGVAVPAETGRPGTSTVDARRTRQNQKTGPFCSG